MIDQIRETQQVSNDGTARVKTTQMSDGNDSIAARVVWFIAGVIAVFLGLFGYTQTYGVSRFEVSTLVAIAVYLLVAFGISKLVTIRQPR